MTDKQLIELLIRRDIGYFGHEQQLTVDRYPDKTHNSEVAVLFLYETAGNAQRSSGKNIDVLWWISYTGEVHYRLYDDTRIWFGSNRPPDTSHIPIYTN